MYPGKSGNKIVDFYLKNPCAPLTLLYSQGNAADLGQLYELFVQLKANLRVNLIGLLPNLSDFGDMRELGFELGRDQPQLRATSLHKGFGRWAGIMVAFTCYMIW
ncbi:unnamed protein product [Camellia sinensis]